jgi:putative thioredoxin
MNQPAKQLQSTKAMSFEVSDFQEDVIEKSRETPVLVDFWAPWCGPCRVLGPVLEKLAGEANGQWTLAKLNTDQNPEVSMQYGIRGIPAVKLFVDGEVVDEFVGALPEYAVKQWLEKALPSENKQRVEQAQAALDADNPELAEALLRQVLDEEPNDPKAQILMAQVLLFRDPEQAAELARSAAFAGPAFVQTQEAVQTITRLLDLDASDLPEEDGKTAYLAARDALARRAFDDALAQFIQVIRTNRYFDDDGARKACLALFNLLGEQHPITRKHRPAFNMSLY